jgi:hypothetical protein
MENNFMDIFSEDNVDGPSSWQRHMAIEPSAKPRREYGQNNGRL